MPCTPFSNIHYSPFIIFSLCSLHTIFTCGGKARMAHACQAPFGSMTNHPHLPRAHHDSSATQGTLASDQFDFHGNHPLLMSLSLLSLSLAIITPHVSATPPNPESDFVSIDVALDCEPVRNFKNSDAQFLPISSRLARPDRTPLFHSPRSSRSGQPPQNPNGPTPDRPTKDAIPRVLQTCEPPGTCETHHVDAMRFLSAYLGIII